MDDMKCGGSVKLDELPHEFHRAKEWKSQGKVP